MVAAHPQWLRLIELVREGRVIGGAVVDELQDHAVGIRRRPDVVPLEQVLAEAVVRAEEEIRPISARDRGEVSGICCPWCST